MLYWNVDVMTSEQWAISGDMLRSHDVVGMVEYGRSPPPPLAGFKVLGGQMRSEVGGMGRGMGMYMLYRADLFPRARVRYQSRYCLGVQLSGPTGGSGGDVHLCVGFVYIPPQGSREWHGRSDGQALEDTANCAQ